MIDKISFENLSFGFEGHPGIFQNVDFEFPMNQTVWIRAMSGAGRSSLLQILAALQMPNEGKYFINDQNITELSFEEFLPYRLAIGYGFDYGGLLNNRSVFENISLPLFYHKMLPAAQVKERVDYYINALGMNKYRDLRPSFIPGGVRKLTCMVRALAVHPEMLLLDDPSVGLDQDTALKFFDIVRDIQKNENRINHLFVSSFDEKLMKVINPTEIFIQGGGLFTESSEIKKVASL